MSLPNDGAEHRAARDELLGVKMALHRQLEAAPLARLVAIAKERGYKDCKNWHEPM